MKTIKTGKRLQLNRETVRQLTDKELARVPGGLMGQSSQCATGIKGCSARCYSEVHLTCGRN